MTVTASCKVYSRDNLSCVTQCVIYFVCHTLCVTPCVSYLALYLHICGSWITQNVPTCSHTRTCETSTIASKLNLSASVCYIVYISHTVYTVNISHTVCASYTSYTVYTVFTLYTVFTVYISHTVSGLEQHGQPSRAQPISHGHVKGMRPQHTAAQRYC